MDRDPDWIGIELGTGIRSECVKAKLFTKIEKREEIPCFEVLNGLFWGLEASHVA
jgi:hypothetical protein